MTNLHPYIKIESRSMGDPYEWDDYLVNTHPNWTLTVTFRVRYSGLDRDAVQTRVLAPQQSHYVDGVDHGPSPTIYEGVDVISVHHARHISDSC